MQINRHAELFRGFEDRPKELVVEIAPAVVAVDHGAGEFLLAHAPLELLRGLVRFSGRQHGKATDALWIFLDRGGEEIVGVADDCRRVGLLQLLDARRGERDDLHVDAGRVHGGDTLVAEVAQFGDQFLGAGVVELFRLLLEIAPRTVEKRRSGKVFFERDGAHDSSHSPRCFARAGHKRSAPRPPERGNAISPANCATRRRRRRRR